MKNTIRAIKALEEHIKKGNVPYEVTEAMREVVSTFVTETIKMIEFRAKKEKDDATPPERKAGLLLSIAYLLKDARPYEREIRAFNKEPRYVAWLDKHYEKVTELEMQERQRYKNKRSSI